MTEKKRAELRSTGQPRAAVPAFFLGILVIVICGIVVGGAKAQPGGASQAVSAPGPKKAEEQFKDIQVFKGIPADQLIPAMQFIAASLGVECEFCHVQGAFEKNDKKPKQTARKMIEMMFAINKDNFEGHREVTCFSCHRGRTVPVAIPGVMAEEAKTGTYEAQSVESGEEGGTSGPSPDQLLEKYLTAVGGAGAVEKVTSRVMKGAITFGDRNIAIDIYSKDPGKRVSFTHTPEGDSITAFDGHEGWLGVPKRPVREMHGPDVDAAAMDADLHFPAHLKAIFSEVKVRGKETLGGRDAYVVIGQREGKTPLRLYFDEQSGLLVRLVRLGETPLGQLPTQVDYADYREVSGVKIPFRWTLARPGGRFTIQLSEVKQNVPVDDAKFAKPPAPPEEHKELAK
ncbi:MAG TPA: c-type cytochrome [Candidatus Polarisedimenticolia bacterium]|nr:c-type cytochrome [Candidatus Polarisedimenticolia bacterium]